MQRVVVLGTLDMTYEARVTAAQQQQNQIDLSIFGSPNVR
jgi:hypothetical protein